MKHTVPSKVQTALSSPADTPQLTDAQRDFADLIGRELARRWLAESADCKDTSNDDSAVIPAPSSVPSGSSSP